MCLQRKKENINTGNEGHKLSNTLCTQVRVFIQDIKKDPPKTDGMCIDISVYLVRIPGVTVGCLPQPHETLTSQLLHTYLSF